MGPGQIFLNRVRSGEFLVAWVGSGQPSMVWVWIWKISPKKVKFFNFFPFGSKKKSLRVGSKSTWLKGRSPFYLLRVKSMLGLGQGPSLERTLVLGKSMTFTVWILDVWMALEILLTFSFGICSHN